MDTIKVSPIYEVARRKRAQFSNWDGWQVVEAYGTVEAETAVIHKSVALSDQSHNGKIRIEGDTAGTLLQADDLAINGGKNAATGQVYRLRRDLFFVSTAVENVAKTAVTLAKQANHSTDLITVTDVTHGNAELWLVGPKSAELLSRLCSLDFHNNQFPNMTAKQSSVAKTTQLIIRRDLGDLPAYVLIGSRSLATYLWETIIEAGQELGVQPVGLTALRQLKTTDLFIRSLLQSAGA